MDSLAIAVTMGVVGMAVTMVILALLAAIFYLFGKAGQSKMVSAEVKPIKKEADIGDVLPFIAAAVYLYGTRGRGRVPETVQAPESVTKKRVPLADSNREEWKRSARRDFLR
ncbi:MAG: OadG family protein [Candidatus Methanomethylicaceae archaeon]